MTDPVCLMFFWKGFKLLCGFALLSIWTQAGSSRTQVVFQVCPDLSVGSAYVLLWDRFTESGIFFLYGFSLAVKKIFCLCLALVNCGNKLFQWSWNLHFFCANFGFLLNLILLCSIRIKSHESVCNYYIVYLSFCIFILYGKNIQWTVLIYDVW